MKLLAFAAMLMVAASTAAQQYKWVDQNGRMQYGDTPPTGVKATRLRAPSEPPSSTATGAAKSLTPAEQEAEFRKRQADAQKAQEKDSQAAQNEQAKRDNCANARLQLSELESGQRIARMNAQGERYYVDDEQRVTETARARKAVSDWCS
jgi:hypothetical protein